MRKRPDKNRKQSNHRPKLKAWLKAHKQTLKCTDCELDFKDQHWLCDFHHTDPSTKELPVATLVGLGASLIRIQNEIAKCIPLCANCHRTRHFKENE